MILRLFVSLVWLLVVWASVASAVDIQYELSTTWVSAVSDQNLPSTDGHGLITLTGHTASEIVWPVPLGCPVGTGTSQWSRVTDPNNVTVGGAGLAVRPNLIFFSTTSPLLPGCHLTGSWTQLRSLVETTVIEAVNTNALVLALNVLNVAAQVQCPGATGGATCDSVRASMSTLNGSYPSAASLNTFLGQVVTLRADALALKAAQGW